MAFRTMEISRAAEIHIKEGQLEVKNEDGTIQVPIEDLIQIMAHGANIRLSTMDLSILAKNKITLVTLDEKYLPTAIVIPFEGHTRQSKLMQAQIKIEEKEKLKLWQQIIKKKISNQSRALSIMGLGNAEIVASYMTKINYENVDIIEALAAREYFTNYHQGLNRRTEDPINSRLNYGYAVVRSAIIRSLVSAGFHPAFGIHHNNQLNLFNLADDLIEPFRAMVDMVAINNAGSNIILNKNERRNLANVLHNACKIDETKVSILVAIDLMCESLKRIVLECSDEDLRVPTLLPIEKMEGITE